MKPIPNDIYVLESDPHEVKRISLLKEWENLEIERYNKLSKKYDLS